jgi:hypothetical protein
MIIYNIAFFASIDPVLLLALIHSSLIYVFKWKFYAKIWREIHRQIKEFLLEIFYALLGTFPLIMLYSIFTQKNALFLAGVNELHSAIISGIYFDKINIWNFYPYFYHVYVAYMMKLALMLNIPILNFLIFSHIYTSFIYLLSILIFFKSVIEDFRLSSAAFILFLSYGYGGIAYFITHDVGFISSNLFDLYNAIVIYPNTFAPVYFSGYLPFLLILIILSKWINDQLRDPFIAYFIITLSSFIIYASHLIEILFVAICVSALVIVAESSNDYPFKSFLLMIIAAFVAPFIFAIIYYSITSIVNLALVQIIYNLNGPVFVLNISNIVLPLGVTLVPLLVKEIRKYIKFLLMKSINTLIYFYILLSFLSLAITIKVAIEHIKLAYIIEYTFIPLFFYPVRLGWPFLIFLAIIFLLKKDCIKYIFGKKSLLFFVVINELTLQSIILFSIWNLIPTTRLDFLFLLSIIVIDMLLLKDINSKMKIKLIVNISKNGSKYFIINISDLLLLLSIVNFYLYFTAYVRAWASAPLVYVNERCLHIAQHIINLYADYRPFTIIPADSTCTFYVALSTSNLPPYLETPIFSEYLSPLFQAGSISGQLELTMLINGLIEISSMNPLIKGILIPASSFSMQGQNISAFNNSLIDIYFYENSLMLFYKSKKVKYNEILDYILNKPVLIYYYHGDIYSILSPTIIPRFNNSILIHSYQCSKKLIDDVWIIRNINFTIVNNFHYYNPRELQFFEGLQYYNILLSKDFFYVTLISGIVFLLFILYMKKMYKRSSN